MSKLSLVNNALGVLNQLPIADLDSTTDGAAVVVEREFDLALTEFLSEAFWSWAKTRAALSEASPTPSFGFSHQYLLPADFISVVGLNETYADTPSDIWEIESGYLLTNYDEANLEYIYKPDDSGLETFLARMDPKAANAFVVLLASKIAPALVQGGADAATRLLQRYYGVDLPKARARNGNQQRHAPRFFYPTSTNLRQRVGFSNG